MGIGLLLAARRIVGAFTAEVPPGKLLVTAAIATVLVIAARRTWRRAVPLQASTIVPQHNYSWWFDQLVGWCSSLALALWAFGCSYPFTRLIDSFIWVPLLVADQFWRQYFFDGGNLELQVSPLGNTRGDLRACDSPERAPSAPTSSSDDQTADNDCLQQVFRVREADGHEAVYATVLADFDRGQRHATVHVAFCPPLAFLPKIEADPCAGPPCDCRVVQALAHGARIDVRLLAPAARPTRVAIDLAARHPTGAC